MRIFLTSASFLVGISGALTLGWTIKGISHGTMAIIGCFEIFLAFVFGWLRCKLV